ncbi:MAG: 30S ribosomal protein S17 [Anaerolineales bacterium]|nr:30S ribosomal protein S17 [Anaerolineales bacterium]HEY61561.1 30S ribosomal protein S17 [Anaerolineae bacterium]
MNNRRRLTGVVVSDKMQKTVVVQVTRTYRHHLYKKVIAAHKRYKAHDEFNCREGDRVKIVESHPISRHKRWVVEEILERAAGGEKEIEEGAEVMQ